MLLNHVNGKCQRKVKMHKSIIQLCLMAFLGVVPVNAGCIGSDMADGFIPG